VLRGHEPTDRAEVSGITRDLVPSDWIEIDGLRVTTPLRTALDLGCSLAPHVALGAMDALMRRHGFTHHEMRVLLRRHGFTHHEMRVLLRRYRRRRGVVQLRQLVAAVDPRAESQPESWVRWFIIQAEMARPTPQVWVTIEGREIRLDLAYPRARIAVEYDGEEFHTAPQQRVHDGERRAALRRAGWIVIVVTRAGLTLDGRDVWLSALSEALRVRRVR
jgi:hypothetical protein